MDSRIRNQWIGLSVLVGVYLALFIVYYPPTHGIEDEVGFINQTLALSRGAVTAAGAGFDSLYDFRDFKGRSVGIRNPGRPALSVPFVLAGGPGSIFLSGAFIHVLLTLTAGLALAALGCSPLWGSLVLLHPTLSLYSRTVLGDTAAGLFLLLAILAVLRSARPGFWAGLSIGLAATMRYQAGLALPFFALALLSHPGLSRRRLEAVRCLATGAAAGLLIVLYNLHLYGSTTGIVKGLFGIGYVPGNAAFYIPALLVIWPLMLLTPLLDRAAARWCLPAAYLPYFVFYLLYYFHDRGSGWTETLVLGQRLLQIALPAWIVHYAFLLDTRVVRRLHGLRARRLVPLLAVPAILVLVMLNLLMFSRHQAHLERLVETRDAITAHVPAGATLYANSVAGKLLGVPLEGLDDYRLTRYDLGVDPPSPPLGDRFFMAVLVKRGALRVDEEDYRRLLARYRCTPVTTPIPDLRLHECSSTPILD